MFDNSWILPKKIKYLLTEVTCVAEMKMLIECSLEKKKNTMLFTMIEENKIDEFCSDYITVSHLTNSEGQCYIFELGDTYVD